MERKWSGGAEPRASQRPQSFGFGPGPINGHLSPYKYHTEGVKVMCVFLSFKKNEGHETRCVFAPKIGVSYHFDAHIQLASQLN